MSQKNNNRAFILHENKHGMIELNVAECCLTELPCDIPGLVTVEVINASQNQMTHLPNKIGSFKRLHILDIHKNSIQKLPATITDCTNLRYINASDNNLSYLPPTLYNLKKLKYLRLAGNWLHFLDEELCWSSSLELLDVSRNKLQIIPYEIKQLTELRVLDLSENSISSLPTHIYLLKRLRSLNLKGNQLNSLPMQTSMWSKLQEINLADNKFCEIPASIYSMESLLYLNMASNKVQSCPLKLEKLFCLEVFHIEFNELTMLGHLPRGLLHLNCSHNNLQILSVQGLPSLRYLNCTDNQLEFAPLGLIDAVEIEFLLLSNNRIRDLPSAIPDLKKLKVLDLENNELENIPSLIDKNCQLQKFNIQGNNLSNIAQNTDINTTCGRRKSNRYSQYVQQQVDLVTQGWVHDSKYVEAPGGDLLGTEKTDQSPGNPCGSDSLKIGEKHKRNPNDARQHDLLTLKSASKKLLAENSALPTPTSAMSLSPTLVSIATAFPSSSMPKTSVSPKLLSLTKAKEVVVNSKSPDLHLHKQSSKRMPSISSPLTCIDDFLNQLDDDNSSSMSVTDIKDSFTVSVVGGIFSSSQVPEVKVEFSIGAVDKNFSFRMQIESLPKRMLESLKAVSTSGSLENLISLSLVLHVMSDERAYRFHKPVTIYLPVDRPALTGYLHILTFNKSGTCDLFSGSCRRDRCIVEIDVMKFQGGVGAVVTTSESVTKAIESVEQLLGLIYI